MSSFRSLAAINGYLSAQTSSRGGSSAGEPRGARGFITISRLAGAGAHAVGEQIVELLNTDDPGAGWTLFDRDLIQAVLELHDLPRELSRYMPEDRIGTFRDTFEAVLGLHPSSDTLVRKTNEAILTLAGLGHAILVGRGANVLTRSMRGGIHVRLVAERRARLRYMAKHYGVDLTRAELLVDRRDEGRRRYLRHRFREDIDDPLGYDLVINTTRFGHGAAASMIAGCVRRGHAIESA